MLDCVKSYMPFWFDKNTVSEYQGSFLQTETRGYIGISGAISKSLRFHIKYLLFERKLKKKTLSAQEHKQIS